jgi:predicted transposase YbfD/YdcC
MANESSAGGISSFETLDRSIVKKLLKSLTIVEDPRKPRGKRHALINVLAVAVLGFMSGCDNAEALEDWGQKEADWLSGFLHLPYGTPSQDVFLRVFASIKPEQIQEAFVTWAHELMAHMGLSQQIAIDGQTNKGSRQRRIKVAPIHMVSALACGEGLVLGQVKTAEKSNEIKAIPNLLNMLNIQGSLVTIDAMGCQVSIARQITKGGGDYLLGLKGNQGTLHENVKKLFETTELAEYQDMKSDLVQQASEHNTGHGREELRRARIIHDFNELIPSVQRWPELKSLVAIDSERTEAVSAKKSTETRYYISSKNLTPEQAIQGTRQHWAIENKLHWVLDVSFGQDANQTRVRYAAENLAVVRHFALNIIRNYTGDKLSVPRRRRLCDYKIDYREKMLGLR